MAYSRWDRSRAIFCKDRIIPYPYGLLSTTSRLILGLRQSTLLEEHEIAHVVGMPVGQLRHFVRRMNRNKDSRYVVITGLPGMFGEEVPGDQVVRCKYCKRLLVRVPCVSCCDRRITMTDRTERLQAANAVPPEDSEATEELPGSLGKIEVMRLRHSRGLRVFHKGDAKIWE